MKKNILLAIGAVLFLQTLVSGQITRTVTDLPDISVIGNFQTKHSESGVDADVKEMEFSFQHYLYPSVKADIFTALHKNSHGEMTFELEEAYVTFFDFYGILNPNTKKSLGIGALVGKKLLPIGKINQQHPEQWIFIDRSVSAKAFLGQEEGLSAEGGQITSLLPLPFFSQVEIGLWTSNPHHHGEEDASSDHESHSETSIDYTNTLLTTRFWNSFSITSNQELEFGINYLEGNATAKSSDDKQSLFAADLTYTFEFNGQRKAVISSELFSGLYGHDGEEKETQNGGSIGGYFKFNKKHTAGLRYDLLGKHGNEGEATYTWSVLLSRNLTETSKFKLQYSTNNHSDSEIMGQFIFGMGPHSHVLQ
jgi:hypothetical protein